MDAQTLPPAEAARLHGGEMARAEEDARLIKSFPVQLASLLHEFRDAPAAFLRQELLRQADLIKRGKMP